MRMLTLTARRTCAILHSVALETGEQEVEFVLACLVEHSLTFSFVEFERVRVQTYSGGE